MKRKILSPSIGSITRATDNLSCGFLRREARVASASSHHPTIVYYIYQRKPLSCEKSYFKFSFQTFLFCVNVNIEYKKTIVWIYDLRISMHILLCVFTL